MLNYDAVDAGSSTTTHCLPSSPNQRRNIELYKN